MAQRSNLTVQWARNTLINCMWYRSRLRKASLLRIVPTFLPDQQARVGSLLRTEAFLPGTSLLLNAQRTNYLHEGGFDQYLRASIYSRESSNRVAKPI